MNLVLAKAASASSVPTLEFPFAAPPSLGETIDVRPGCLWLRMPLPFALDHINLWLLQDGDGWTIVDTGLNLPVTQEGWDQIFTRLGARIKRVVVTHCHPDHFGLAGWLTRRFDVPLWMPQAEFLAAHALYSETSGHGTEPTLKFFNSHGLDVNRQQSMSQRGNSYRRGVYEPPVQYRRISVGEAVSIGNHEWKTIFGYGHSPEHAALYCESLGLLISGDMLLPKISTNVSVWALEPESDPVKQFLNSIDLFKPLPADTLALPSHGLPFRGIQTRIEQLHRHHQERLSEVLEKCTTWTTAEELLSVLFRRALDTHQTFFAMGEAIAHLNNLWYQGKLDREHSPGGINRFRRAT
jgi:glyoxylase-like metal-dependent hydrolase (beta-lactamase superfamily II)